MIKLFRRRIGPPITLDTERFVLSSLTRSEMARLTFPWTNDPEVMASMQNAVGGWTLRRWRKQVIKSNNRDKFAFGITDRTSGDMIGYETAQMSETKVAILGVAIGNHEWWGRSVVVETRAAVLDFLFDKTPCVRAWGIVYSRNFPSISNYHSLGFQHEATLRDHFLLPGGERGDCLGFGVLRAEWLARRNGGAADVGTG